MTHAGLDRAFPSGEKVLSDNGYTGDPSRFMTASKNISGKIKLNKLLMVLHAKVNQGRLKFEFIFFITKLNLFWRFRKIESKSFEYTRRPPLSSGTLRNAKFPVLIFPTPVSLPELFFSSSGNKTNNFRRPQHNVIMNCKCLIMVSKLPTK